MTDDILEVARWRTRLPKVRESIRALTGFDTTEVIPDETLASVVTKCSSMAKTAIGDTKALSPKDAAGVATAVAVAAAAIAIIHARRALDAAQWAEFEKRLHEAVARVAAKAVTPDTSVN